MAQLQSNDKVTASVAAPHSPLPRMLQAAPVSMHTSHAMMLQLQEYRTRVRDAFQSTYRHPLTVAPTPPSVPVTELPPRASNSAPSRTHRRGSYCRTRVLESSRQLFAVEARRGAPACPSSPRATTRSSLKGGGVAFHRSTASSRTPVRSSLFALGPGQYDVAPRRPATTGSVKFSPADRFPEHSGGGDQDQHAPGPGQYLPSDELVAKRATRVVFSQLPRHSEIAAPPQATITEPPATANVVSSYYYTPSSSFAVPGDAAVSIGGGQPSWGRPSRLRADRRSPHRRAEAQTSPNVNYITRNMASIEALSAEQRQRRRLQHAAAVAEAAAASRDSLQHQKLKATGTARVKRRGSLFVPDTGTLGLPEITMSAQRRRSSVASVTAEARRASAAAALETVSRGWSTLTVLAAAQTKLTRLLVVASVLRRLRDAQELQHQRATFTAWTHLRDRDALRSLGAALIARNTFRLRMKLRVERKVQAARLLRLFLYGLSMDVRFAVAVRRVQRRLVLLQRWWCHVRLVVRAREQSLVRRWLLVEQRLRSEHVAQIPHLQRIFQPPVAGALAVGSAATASRRKSSVVGGGGNGAPSETVEASVPLYKLLYVPEQRLWFSARFELSADGVLRGYAVPRVDSDAAVNNHSVEDASGAAEQLVLELKYFRCHAHGNFASLNPLTSLSTVREVEEEDESDWKPFLMVFRPGANRFVLLAASSSVQTEILDWKDKLEHLASTASGSLVPGDNSMNDLSDLLTQAGFSALESTSGGSVSVSANQQHRLQSRRRSSRVRVRRSQALPPVAEGQLSYYVIDLLKDFPCVPPEQVRSALHDKLREERKSFRAEIYRYQLEISRFQQHQREARQIHVLDKFHEFFTLERPRRPHFRSLISSRRMEALVRQTVEHVKTTQPSNPSLLLQ